MIWVTISLLVVALVAGIVMGTRYLRQRRERIMAENEYNTAVAIWEFARTVKDRLAEVSVGSVAVLNFTTMKMPRVPGYRLSLELTFSGFALWAVPDRYNKTGRLSFYSDKSLTVRAQDHAGAPAELEDPEYTGQPQPAA
jgi:hypothetical protein